MVSHETPRKAVVHQTRPGIQRICSVHRPEIDAFVAGGDCMRRPRIEPDRSRKPVSQAVVDVRLPCPH
jgi:hypothetical protein